MYTNLKIKLDNLNKDNSHFLNSNDICTPMDCVEEMVNKIPEELWNRENISILDPCAGNGNFPAFILEKIKNEYTLQANEINGKRVHNLKKLFGDKIKITEEDFLINDFDKKYDLIVANPPYALINSQGKRAAKNHSVFKEFIKKSLSILNEDGYLVFIVPDNWMSLSDRNDIVHILSEYQFIYLDIHGAKKYFPNVGSSFTWFVLKKSENKEKFIISNNFSKKELSLALLEKGAKSIPLFYNDTIRSILNKTIYSNHNKFKVETSSDLHKYTKRDLLSNEKNDEYKYEIIHTLNQTVFSKRPHKFQNGYKVYIVLTSYYHVFVDLNKGMTQSIAFIRSNNLDDAEKIKETLLHPLYIFINNIHRYGNFNNIRILQKFPIPAENNIWNSFNISEEEKNFILSFING